MVPQAYLRVLQPLDAFSPEEKARWERYIVEGGFRHRSQPIYRQRVAVGRLGLLSQTDGNDADVRLVDGEYYVCPWRTRIRVLAGLLSLRETSVPEMADALVPESEARRAARELARLKRRDPSAVPFMLQSAWHVPVRWFILVKDEERRLIEREDGRYSLKYETTVGKARVRVDWALAVVQKTELEPLTELVRDLQLWLASFDRRSVLELDYASLSSLFTWDELDDDRSARDVLEAIEALQAGEMSRSAEAYQQVAGRWAEVRAHESLN